MSDVAAVQSKTELSWWKRNEANVGYALVISGIALVAITLGIVGAASGTSPHFPNYPSSWFKSDGNLNNCGSDIATTNAMGFFIGYGGGMGGAIVSVLMITGGGSLIYHANKQAPKRTEKVEKISAEEARSDVCKQRWRSVAKWIAFFVTFFAIGMIIASSVMLNSVTSHMKDLIDQGRAQYPDDADFFNDIQSQWLDPTQSMMKGLVSIGTIMSVAAGGIFLYCGGHDLAKRFFKSEQTDNDTVAPQTDAEI